VAVVAAATLYVKGLRKMIRFLRKMPFTGCGTGCIKELLTCS